MTLHMFYPTELGKLLLRMFNSTTSYIQHCHVTVPHGLWLLYTRNERASTEKCPYCTLKSHVQKWWHDFGEANGLLMTRCWHGVDGKHWRYFNLRGYGGCQPRPSILIQIRRGRLFIKQKSVGDLQEPGTIQFCGGYTYRVVPPLFPPKHVC